MKKKTSFVYLDNHSLLVINSKGKLRTLYTPFRVKCIDAVGGIPAGTWVVVDEIYRCKNSGINYLVNNEQISYKYFQIEIKF